MREEGTGRGPQFEKNDPVIQWLDTGLCGDSLDSLKSTHTHTRRALSDKVTANEPVFTARLDVFSQCLKPVSCTSPKNFSFI